MYRKLFSKMFLEFLYCYKNCFKKVTRMFQRISEMIKQGRIHDSISRLRWAGAVTEVRSPFSEKK